MAGSMHACQEQDDKIIADDKIKIIAAREGRTLPASTFSENSDGTY
jgi:hypothetical protein